MNKTVERAYEINEKEENFEIDIPKVEIDDIVNINEIWDGEGNKPEKSYSYIISESGEDGNENLDVYINYTFEKINDEMIKIIDIQILWKGKQAW